MAFGDPTPNIDPSMMQVPQPSMGALAAALPGMAAPKAKINWLGVLADALAGAAGRQGPYASMLMQQRQLQQQQQMEQAQSDRELQRQKDLYSFELSNPRPTQPTETERMMQRYLDPNTPSDEKALIGQQLIKPQAITVTNPDGSQELRFIYPGQQQQPMKPVGKLTPIGGPSPSGSGGFR